VTSDDHTAKKEAQPLTIRYRLRHVPQSAFAATRPGSMQKMVETSQTVGRPASRPKLFHGVTLVLALAAAVVAASIAQANPTTAKVDPLAVGYLQGQGYTPAQIKAWTVGACSHASKPAPCFGPSRGANLIDLSTKVDPLAVGYLIGQGLSPSEVTSWTTGDCSRRLKDVSCYAMLRPVGARKAVDPLAVGYLIGQGLPSSEVTAWTSGICSHRIKDASCYAMLRPAATGSTVALSTGFQWRDAGIGAGFALAIILLGGAGAGLLISRRHQHHKTAQA
jgi:hypothetical protein